MASPHPKGEHNITKMRGNYQMPSSRVRGKYAAREEMSEANRSIADLLPLSPIGSRHSSSAGVDVLDNVLYSFDRADTPGRPLALDVFVKTTGRDTERLVEKEYEVLDANGEPLRGRKARRNLRKAVTDLGRAQDADAAEEDDGFELV